MSSYIERMSNKKLFSLLFLVLLFAFMANHIQEASITGFQSSGQTTEKAGDAAMPKKSIFQNLPFFGWGKNKDGDSSKVLQFPQPNDGDIIASAASGINIYYPKNNKAYNKTVLDLNVSSPKIIVLWSYSLNNQANITFVPNTTITASVGVNNLIVYAKDTLNNETHESIQFLVDLRTPFIKNQTKTPEPSYNDNNVTFSAIIFDRGSPGVEIGPVSFMFEASPSGSPNPAGAFGGSSSPSNNDPGLQSGSQIVPSSGLQAVWISGNWTGTWENFTVKSHAGEFYFYTVTVGNFSNQEQVGWFFNANDTAGNEFNAPLQNFTVANRPPQPSSLIEPPNNSVVSTNQPSFNWSDGIDLDNDTLTYNLFVATDPSIESIVVSKIGLNQSNYTLTAIEQLADGVYYWQIITNDSYSMNISNVSQFEIIPGQSISLSLSEKLATGITWNVTFLPAVNLSAEGNNNTGVTGYDAFLLATGTDVDVYIRADANLETSGGDSIELENEKFTVNLIDSSVPEGVKFSLTKNYEDNKIGVNASSGASFYFKFYLDVAASQSPGIYSNNITILAVPADTVPVYNFVIEENPDVSSCDGAWSGAASNCSEVTDGDYNSFGSAALGQITTVYINYTKQTEVFLGSKWQVKDRIITNLTIPLSCFSEDPLRFRAMSLNNIVPNIYSTHWDCGDNTGTWINLRVSDSINPENHNLYEEGIYWNKSNFP